jgi:esterase/lipase superfamily enzyme
MAIPFVFKKPELAPLFFFWGGCVALSGVYTMRLLFKGHDVALDNNPYPFESITKVDETKLFLAKLRTRSPMIFSSLNETMSRVQE